MRVVARFVIAALVGLAVVGPAVAQETLRPEPPDTLRGSPRDDNRDRMFGGPTGRTLQAGTGTVGVQELFFPYVTVGVTDRVQITGGAAVAPDLVGEVFYLAPKAGLVSRRTVDLAVGVIAFFATGDLDEGTVGILHGVGTFGTTDRALTVGAGWPFIATGDDSEIADRPVVSLGGEIRTGRNVKLMSENYFGFGGGDGFGLVSGGLRVFGDRLSADLGLAGLFDEGDSACCLPIVNVSYAFGGGDR